MMRRAVLVLATVAALLGAPPTASAASNALHSPVVTPSSGPMGTTFVLRVTYEGRFPASAVIATVGTTSFDMSRISGSAEAGTWQVSATGLPAGLWPVTFVAAVARGNAPVLDGGTLTVAGAATPVTTTTPVPSAERPSGQRPTGGTPTNAPAPPAQPGDVAPADAPSRPSEPSATTEPTEIDATGPAGARGAAEPDGDDGRSGDAAPAQPGPDRRRTSATAPPSAPAPGPRARSTIGSSDASPSVAVHGGSAATSPDEEIPSDSWPIALWSAALTGLIGVIFLVLGRRRHATAEAATAAELAEDTATLLRRRALRRARTVIDSDPIVASMGIDEAALAERGPERRRLRRREQA